MTDTTQTVVDKTDTTAQPVVEAGDARTQGDDLDSLLADFDKQTQTVTTSPPQNEAVTQPDVKALLEKVQSLESRVSQVDDFKFKQDMKKTVDAVRGDLDPEIVDDSLVEAWLDAQARNDTRLQKAWINREANPQQFKNITAELGKRLAKKFSKLPDRQVTEDVAAVTAAVRGASTRAPAEPPLKLGNLSNAEYRKEVRDKFGFDPGV